MTAGWKLFTHWEIRLSLAYHVAGAVDYMHCRGLIHRDLTSANLLVGANWQAKVINLACHFAAMVAAAVAPCCWVLAGHCDGELIKQPG